MTGRGTTPHRVTLEETDAMIRSTLAAVPAAAVLALPLAVAADPWPPRGPADRVEDRRDRREDRRETRWQGGRRDRAEDRWDARENRWDRRENLREWRRDGRAYWLN